MDGVRGVPLLEQAAAEWRPEGRLVGLALQSGLERFPRGGVLAESHPRPAQVRERGQPPRGEAQGFLEVQDGLAVEAAAAEGPSEEQPRAGTIRGHLHRPLGGGQRARHVVGGEPRPAEAEPEPGLLRREADGLLENRPRQLVGARVLVRLREIAPGGARGRETPDEPLAVLDVLHAGMIAGPP